MSSYVPCKKNDANGYVFYVSLVSQADTKLFQVNPTLAAGDFKIAVDDAAPGNLGTLPVVDADFTKRVKIVLSQAETNGDNLTVICSDAAGAEWCDLTINIQTSAQTLDEIDVNVDDIETDTAVIGALGAGLSAIPWNATWDAEVQSECADALTAYDPPTKTEMDTAHALLATPAQVATALTNYDPPTKAEMDTGHTLLATVAKQDVIDGIVDNILVDTGTTLDAALAVVDANVDAILVDTGTTLDGIVDAILVDTGTTIPALIAALNNISTAQVNAEVVDAIGTDTLAELAQAAPSATPTVKTALMLLYMIARDKLTTTSTELGIYNNAGTKIAKKTLSDDGTTYTESNMVSGA